MYSVVTGAVKSCGRVKYSVNKVFVWINERGVINTRYFVAIEYGRPHNMTAKCGRLMK